LVTICQSGIEAGIDWEKRAEGKLQSMAASAREANQK